MLLIISIEIQSILRAIGYAEYLDLNTILIPIKFKGIGIGRALNMSVKLA